MILNQYSYNGNPLLKPAGQTHELTPEQIEAIATCALDPIHFITEYVKIVSVDDGIIPFDLWDFQEDLVQAILDNRFTIAKLPRQVGKTTVVAAILLYYIIFNKNYSIAILANKADQAREILSRVQLAYENLPYWMQQGVIEWNKGSVSLDNGSSIIASSTSSSAIRGRTMNLVYMDELAFVPRNIQEGFFTSVYPTITSGKTTKIVITSTPNGLDYFYKIWKGSEDEENDFVRISAHWSQVPGRDEAWKKETLRNIGQAQFDVEFECEFVGSSDTLIAGYVLKQLVWSEPAHRDNNLKVYKDPKKDHNYCISVDVGRGTGGDYSVATIIDITTKPYEVVAIYRNNEILPMLFPTIIKNFAMLFNEAIVLVEINDIGEQVSTMLYHDLEYSHVVMTTLKGPKGVVMGMYMNSKKATVGVRTTTSVKRLGCSNLKTLVEGDKIVLNDEDLVEELYNFVAVGASYEADTGHDDIVMSLVIFSWMTTQEYFKDLTKHDIRAAMNTDNKKMIEDQTVAIMSDDSIDDEEESIHYGDYGEFVVHTELGDW